jgi:hypothetical protein
MPLERREARLQTRLLMLGSGPVHPLLRMWNGSPVVLRRSAVRIGHGLLEPRVSVEDSSKSLIHPLHGAIVIDRDGVSESPNAQQVPRCLHVERAIVSEERAAYRFTTQVLHNLFEIG